MSNMKVLIIEDEKPAVNRLISLLGKIDESISVAGTCVSVKESVKWLNKNSKPDIIFLDIQLTDGVSLELFKKTDVKSPVIFTTAYDEYVMEAFNHTTIDYLLKPIKEQRLKAAIDKYSKLSSHFTGNYRALFEQFIEGNKKYKTRFTVKSGSDYLTVPIEKIAYFFTDHKIVFLQTSGREKYIVDYNLTQLEEQLDPNSFYRINRKIIANVDFISKFKPCAGGKLLIELFPAFREPATVSQEKAAEFKKWIEG